MSLWSAIVKAVTKKSDQQQVKAAGVLRDDEGWYYEESQNFSKAQSTVRIDQQRPGNWETLASSCGVVGLNKPARQKDVSRFFAGSYKWLRLERGPNGFKDNDVIKVIGTFRDTTGREKAVHLGFLNPEAVEDLESIDVRTLWPKIRFVRFPTPGRGSKYMIRFDLMQDESARHIS